MTHAELERVAFTHACHCRRMGMTAAQIIQAAGEQIPAGRIGYDDAVDALARGWLRLKGNS